MTYYWGVDRQNEVSWALWLEGNLKYSTCCILYNIMFTAVCIAERILSQIEASIENQI